jgi:hypothetical protein
MHNATSFLHVSLHSRCTKRWNTFPYKSVTKICALTQELRKHTNECEYNTSLLGCRKEAVVKYILGNGLQTCELV